jgi:predicted small lipoprotein YifL
MTANHLASSDTVVRTVRTFSRAGLLFAVAFLAGCGGPGTLPPQKMEADTGTLRPRLQQAADSGYLGSAAAGMREAIQELPADKSAKLLKDLDELEQAERSMSQDRVKAIAKKMLDAL